MADLQVSIALLLENQDEIRRALEAEGGKAGEAFRNRLTPAAKKAFDEITSAAEKAAKDVGVRFNSTKLQFETAKGEIIPSSVLDKISQGGSKIAAAFKEARNGVDVFKSAVVSGAGEAASSLNILEAAVTGVAVSLTSKLTDSVTAGLGGLKGLVGGFMELDGELRMAAAAAGETGGYERLGSIVEKVGIDAAGTSKQVAELATSLVRAGFSVSEVEKALPGVVRGAEATGTGFEQMGNIVGNTLRGFGLEAEQVGRVTDVLVNAANSSNASIEGLGYTFEYTAPIAKALGVSLEDVAAAAGLMANAGIQGSVAGTGLRTGLQKLQEAAGGASPAVLGLSRGQERLAQTMKMIGATVTDTAGNLLPLEQVFLNLKDGLSKLSQADQVQLTNILFGDEAGSKFLSITNQSSAAISKMFSDMKNSAGSTDVARDAMAGIGLEVQQLQGTLGAIGTSIGGVLAAGLRPFIQAANAIAGVISGLPEPIKTTGSALIGMAAAAATASVGIGALNVAVASVGGWAAMRAAIASVAAVITGPLGAGVLIFAGLGAAAGVLTGHFRETDRTTKTLLQTAVGLGAFVAVLRGITIAQAAWTAATKGTGVAMAFLTALTGPSGIARVAVAAGVAAAAYYGMGQAIKVTGEETTAMADKSRAVKDEIAQLGKEIEQSKKLNVDTSDLEKLKDAKELELQQIENPLEIKLNIQKAEAQIKSLQEEKDKLGKESSASGSGVLTAQIKAAEKYRDVLKAADEGVGGKAFDKLSDSAKKFVQEQDEIKNKIQALRNEQIELPIDAKVDRAKIDKQILDLQNVANKNELKFKASLKIEELQRQLAIFLAKKAEAEKGVSQGFGETDAGFGQRQAANKKEIEGYTVNIAELQRQIAAAESEALGASEKHANASRERVKSAEEQYNKTKAQAEAENMVSTNQQKQIDNANKLMGMDKSRLENIRQMADAYLNMANAQAGLTQSEFDVDKARNSRDVNVASEELQAMRDRKASEGEIAAKEQEIKQLKEEGRQIEKEALAAAMDAAAKRFEMERKILELKQVSAKLDQEAAVRAAQRAEIDDKRQLIDLKVKQQDPSLSADQKAALGESIALQEESLKLSQAQTAAEKDRLGNIDKEFSMEKELLNLKQNTEANQFRAKAAEQGWEGDLSPQLDNLDKQKGKLGESKVAWKDIAKQADNVVGVIDKHNKAIASGNKKLGDLAKGYKGAGDAASKGGDGKAAGPEMSSGEKARQQELDRTKKWKKEMEAAGFVELKVEGMPQNVSDGIVREAITGKKAPEVDAWFASPEGKAAVDKWRSSAQGATDDLGVFEAAAKQAGVSVEDLGKHLEDVGFVELNAGALEVDQQSIESLQKMRDELFGPEAQKRLFTPEGMKGLPDFSLKPTVDTTQAEQDLQTFKQGEASKPLEVPITTAAPDGSGATQGGQDQAPVIRPQVDTTEADQSMAAFRDQQGQSPFLVDFDATGLDQIQGDLYSANEAVNAFKANGEGAGYDLANGFTNAANSIVPFSNQVNQLGLDLQALDSGEGVDPFQGAGQSLNEAAYGVQALVQGLETAEQSAADFDSTLADSANADQIQQAYDALKPPDVSQAVTEQGTLAQGTEGTIETTQGLADSWADVTTSINTAAQALETYRSQESGGNARFAGGPVLGGHGYTVNELGQESFLSRSGALSLIRAPQYGKWVAPSRGLVIPASMTSQLQSAGAFSRGGRQVATALASPTPGQGNQVAALGRLQRSIDRLEKTLGSYRPPDVHVSVPGNAGLLHTLQSIR